MSKQVTVEMPDHPRNVAPSKECVEKVLQKTVLSLLEVSLGDDGWRAVAEVEASRAKPALKQVAKPKAAAKPKAPAKKPSLGKKKDSE